MKILFNNHKLNIELRPFNDIGFVPTMGGIHDGHISLIKKSQKLCKKTIVSIFINPKQFNNKEDFKKYPNNIKKDLSILKKIKGVDFIYLPKFKDIYNSKRKSKIIINKNDKILCAKFRKGHFEGVIDVMDRLTNLIKPKKIFMGKKDFQQFFLVKKFIEKRYRTKIIGCKTIRDKDNLALSSRNRLLNINNLIVARKVTKMLFQIKRQIRKEININKFLSKSKKNIKKNFKIKVDYLELRSLKDLKISNKTKYSRIFFAYYIGKTRLIDNI